MIDVTPFYNPFKVVEKTDVVQYVKNGVVYKKKQHKIEKVQSVK